MERRGPAFLYDWRIRQVPVIRQGNYWLPRGYFMNKILDDALLDYYAPFYHNAIGTGLETALGIGVGNFLTRNFRQKIIFDNNIVQTMPSNKSVSVAQLRGKLYTKLKNSKPASKAVARNRPNRKSKKTPKSQRKFANKKTIQGLGQQVKEIRKMINVPLSTHVRKLVDTPTSIASLVGRCNHVVVEPVTPTKIETAMDSFRFFNPSAPATLITADYSSGTYMKDVKIKNIRSKLVFRLTNNTPAYLRVYLCKPKNDTALTPLSEYTAALADQVVTAGVDETDALLYITDMEKVRENWEIDCVIDKLLVNGQTEIATHNTGEFTYDPSATDGVVQAYQKRNKSFAWLIRVEGPLGHDTAAPNARTLLNVEGMDYQHFTKYEFQYDSGGAQLNDISIVENRSQSAAAATLVTGVPVVPDNMIASFT